MPMRIEDLIRDRGEFIRDIILDKIISSNFNGYWELEQVLVKVRQWNKDQLPIERNKVRDVLHSLIKKGFVSTHFVDGTLFYKFNP